MLTRLRFKNFKAWRDSGEIRLAPLTVLFGANSAGKTSIPQLLLLLKQTAESPDRLGALQLGDSRTLVDLGTYADAVHNHDMTQPLEIEMGWTLPKSLSIADSISGATFEGDEIDFRVTFQEGRQPIVHGFRYALNHGGKLVLDIEMRPKEGHEKRRGKQEFELKSDRYKPTRHQGRAWSLPKPLRFYGFPEEATAYYQNTAFVADLVLSLEQMLRSIFYVGPLREYPKRLYLWSGETPEHVGVRGDRAVEAILAAGDRKFNQLAKQKTKTLAEVVASRLRSMGLIRDFKLKPLGNNRKEYEVLVRTSSKLPEVKLTDVGFGVSQVLPVIVECFYVPQRSIVIFEQPEIHLHPRVQADLADLFVDAIHAREGRSHRESQFIIESHSEHFLRRLQRRIAEGTLSPSDAALYFVHTEENGARLEELEVDAYGNILNWPEGFFGDEMGDLVARSEAQAKRMAKS